MCLADLFSYRKPYIALLLVSFFAASHSFAQRTIGDPVIGPRDVLNIRVFSEPELTMDVVVSASGEFSYPLLKRVTAAGKTADQLGLHIEKRLLKEGFLREPSVTVILKEQRYASVILSGAVTEPGLVPIFPGIRLREVIAERGGIVKDEAGPFIHIQRLNGEQFKVDRSQLESSNPSDWREANIALLPGDEIVVPNADMVYVLGAVNAPGGFPVTKELTIADVLGLAGGLKPNSGSTMLWHHIEDDDNASLITMSHRQYLRDIKVRSAKVHPGDSLYITQNDFVFVGGEVNNPGSIPWTPNMTIHSAIVAAGDKTFIASNGVTLIRQNQEGNMVKQTFGYSDIKSGNMSGFLVQPGDVIHLPVNPVLNIPYTVRRINPFSFPVTLFDSTITF